MKNMMQGVSFILTRREHRKVMCRQQHTGQQRNPPLRNLCNVDRSRKLFAIFDHWLPWERLAVWASAPMPR